MNCVSSLLTHSLTIYYGNLKNYTRDDDSGIDFMHAYDVHFDKEVFVSTDVFITRTAIP